MLKDGKWWCCDCARVQEAFLLIDPERKILADKDQLEPGKVRCSIPVRRFCTVCNGERLISAPSASPEGS